MPQIEPPEGQIGTMLVMLNRFCWTFKGVVRLPEHNLRQLLRPINRFQGHIALSGCLAADVPDVDGFLFLVILQLDGPRYQFAGWTCFEFADHLALLPYDLRAAGASIDASDLAMAQTAQTRCSSVVKKTYGPFEELHPDRPSRSCSTVKRDLLSFSAAVVQYLPSLPRCS